MSETASLALWSKTQDQRFPCMWLNFDMNPKKACPYQLRVFFFFKQKSSTSSKAIDLWTAAGRGRRGQRSFWSLFYWPDQMRNNGGQCHKHWPRYFLFTRNNDSIWAGASASRLTLELKQHFHTKSEQDYDRWMRRMAPRKKFASTANIHISDRSEDVFQHWYSTIFR